MQTVHWLLFRDSRSMDILDAQSIDLVVTSPPYPMIGMWDGAFSAMDPEIRRDLAGGRGWDAYERMHGLLDAVWQGVCRVLKPGGFACINIGDAVRKVGDDFFLYPNHSRVIRAFLENGLSPLPAVLWRKQTNAPNKFMGSGMLPAGAYVTLEHEYVLIFRKGSKRAFQTPAERTRRQKSAIFWEERNQWFSDIWFDLKGARQQLFNDKLRKRSGAYPFELPYRLINMYSVMGDHVLDPFAGMGTTLFAAMAAGRNSTGFEIEPGFYPEIEKKAAGVVDFANTVIRDRIGRHLAFAAEREASHGPLKYRNEPHGFAVMTRQEKQLQLYFLKDVENPEPGRFVVNYRPVEAADAEPGQNADAAGVREPAQQSLFGDFRP
ncbi:MAG: DNA-methyltransferase [Desulfobacterales bacterium]